MGLYTERHYYVRHTQPMAIKEADMADEILVYVYINLFMYLGGVI